MGRHMILALGLRGIGAIAWFGYFWFLTQHLPAAALGHTLYALALAGVGAMLASAGWTQLALREGARAQAETQPARFANLIRCATQGVLRRASLATLVVLALAGMGALPTTMPSLSFAALTCAITAVLALLQIKSAAQRANRHLIRALAGQGVIPAALPLAVLAIAALFLPITPLLVLSLHLLSLLGILFWLGRGLPDMPDKSPLEHNLHALSFGQAGQVLLNNLDILVLGWLISPADAGIYLIARRVVGLIGLIFDALRSAAAPRLAVAFTGKNAAALASRVNRIFLLVGLTCGGFLWLAAPVILPVFGATKALAAFQYLLLGALTPALFGATGLLLVMGDLEGWRAKLVLGLLPISLITLIWGSHFGITGLAISVAGIQILLGAGGAVLLRHHHGIRPGLFPTTG